MQWSRNIWQKCWRICGGSWGTNYWFPHKCISSSQVQDHVQTEEMDYSWWGMLICVCSFRETVQHPRTTQGHGIHSNIFINMLALSEPEEKNESAVVRIHQKPADTLVFIVLFLLSGLLLDCCQHASGPCLRDLIENKMDLDLENAVIWEWTYLFCFFLCVCWSWQCNISSYGSVHLPQSSPGRFLTSWQTGQCWFLINSCNPTWTPVPELPIFSGSPQGRRRRRKYLVGFWAVSHFKRSKMKKKRCKRKWRQERWTEGWAGVGMYNKKPKSLWKKKKKGESEPGCMCACKLSSASGSMKYKKAANTSPLAGLRRKELRKD